MEVVLNEELKTQVKLCVSMFSKDYMEKMAIVEVVKCIVNADTGEIIKTDFFQNRVFRNRTVPNGMEENGTVQTSEVKDFDLLLSNIQQMGEEAYFGKLLEIIIGETTKQ